MARGGPLHPGSDATFPILRSSGKLGDDARGGRTEGVTDQGPQLLRAFVAGLGPKSVVTPSMRTEVVQELVNLWTRAHTAWPNFSTPANVFVAHVAQHLSGYGDLIDRLRELNAEELYLACACGQGEPLALTAIEQAYGRQIRGAVGTIQDSYLNKEDLLQIVRQKLYVGSDTALATIGRYSGGGSLGGWLRISARRAALDAVRDSHPTNDPLRGRSSSGPDVPQRIEDPEIDFLKQTYRGEFTEGMTSAFSALPPRQQMLLRQSVVHQLSARKIAVMLGTHHSTVARWINDARDELVERTRDILAEKLELTEGQLQSLMRFLKSDFQLSVVRILAPDDRTKDDLE